MIDMKLFKLRRALMTCASGMGLLVAAGGAQGVSAAEAEDELEEIVVTGSLVRGVAPTGANVVSIGQKNIEEAGAQSVPQIIATIPQLSTFGQVAQAPLQNGALGTGRTSFRPTLRNLPAGTVNPILVMVDGHQLVGAGFQQTDADPSIVPPGALERLEVVLDGGSSLYGANAIGGVLNFITRTQFQGVELAANAGGTADNYFSGDISLTAGRNWSGGNGMVSVYYRENTNLANEDRPLPRQDLRQYGFPDYRQRTCSPGNIIIGTTTYALPNRLPGTVNLCDTLLEQDTANADWQASVFASVNQSINDDVDLNFKAIATSRHTTPRTFAFTELSALISNTNPFFRPIGTETSHRVAFNYSAVAGDDVEYDLWLKGVDLSTTLTWRLPGGWRAVGLLNYGRTNTEVYTPLINTAASAAALSGPGLTTATALNPYDLTQTNRAVIDRILDWRTKAENTQSQYTARINVDGALFNVPGGEVKAAFGIQYMNQGTDAIQVTGSNSSLAGARLGDNDRDLYATYAQLNIPVIGANNSLRFMQAFDLDLSARYDHYDTVGGTTNPRVGTTWTVTDGFKLRGTWSTAFTAPTVVDETPTGSVDASIDVVQTGQSGTLLLAGDDPANINRPSMVLNGALPNTQTPQKAKTWSLGFDFAPPQVEGLGVSATFWRVQMTNTLVNGCPGTSEQQVANPQFGCNLRNPTLAQVQTYLPAGLPVRGLVASLETLYNNGTPPYLLVSRIRKNGGAFRSEGIDYRVDYRRQTGWGAMFANVGGTRYLKRLNQASATSAYLDTLVNLSKFNALLSVGADIGERLSGLVRVNHQASYPINNLVGRTRMPAFTTTDLFARYDFNDTTQVTFNLNNVFDKMPIVVNTVSGQYVNANINQQSTLGRYYAVGLRTRF